MGSNDRAASSGGTATGREKCCPDCAGNGMICDYTGKVCVLKKSCERCFGTGFPAWLIRRILWEGPYPPQGKEKVQRGPSGETEGRDGSVSDKGFVTYKRKTDVPQTQAGPIPAHGAAPPGDDPRPNGGKPGEVPDRERVRTGTAGVDRGDAQRGEPGDARRGDARGPDADASPTATESVERRILEILREAGEFQRKSYQHMNDVVMILRGK